jgi:adenine-specific DNA-methyltransferase
MAEPQETTTSAPPQADFREPTRIWLEGHPADERKKLGQYMTPRSVRQRLLDKLDLEPGMRVLDPGAGTGEFLADIAEREPGAELHGWDIDPEVLAVAKKNAPSAALGLRSAIEWPTSELFDLVIGNPPYFQFKASKEMKARFAAVISGRPNIFALFFQAGLELLAPKGMLAFVVPPSMNNGAYFEALREYILSFAEIEDLEVLSGSDLFDGANTAVQLIVLRMGSSSADFTFTRSQSECGFKRIIFSERPAELAQAFEGKVTLWDAGYEAVTGTIVWNQNKASLRSEMEPGSHPLIWAQNIQGGELVLGSTEKRPQFVIASNPVSGPAIVVNRIVGAVGKAGVRAAVVPPGMTFLGENHVNVVRVRAGIEPVIPAEELCDQLNQPETAAAVRLLTGNTQLSATELTHLLPVAA